MAETNHPAERQRVTALVIAYNRRQLIKTCLGALAFADEILVVDKSSTDGTAEIAASLADRVISVPWSPVVEDTRAFAIAQCTHDWILCLDDDECLSPAGIEFFRKEMLAPRGKVYMIPLRHYIAGRHDENAYYWPEFQPRFFHRGAVEIRPVVHGGIVVKTDEIFRIEPESGVCLHHLSHQDAAQWIEKANRYTSNPSRQGEDDGSRDLIAFSHARIDAWVKVSTIEDRGSYPAAVALLRAVYDIIDRVKLWESEEGLVGDAAFAAICRTLDAEYARLYASDPAQPGRRGGATIVAAESSVASAAPEPDRRDQELAALQARARHLRRLLEGARVQARQDCEAATARAHQERDIAIGEAARERDVAIAEALSSASESIRNLTQKHAGAEKVLMERLAIAELLAAQEGAERRQLEARLAAVLSSDFWRLTAPLRFAVEQVRRIVARSILRAQILVRAAKPSNVDHRREVVRAIRRRLGVVVPQLASADGRPGDRAQHPASSGIDAAPVLKSLQHLPPHQAAVASYPIWSLRFDTPAAADLRYLEETASDLPHALVVVRFPAGTHDLIGRTAEALKATVGIRWNAIFVADPDATNFRTACAEAFDGDLRFSAQPSHASFANGIVILLEAGAIPRRHGIRLLVERMAGDPDLVLAYADEDRLSAAGLPELPWFKPDYSPSLAAQGLLYGRMLALRPEAASRHSNADTILDPRRSILQIAMETTHGLPGDRIGHVAHVLFHDILPPAPAPAPAQAPVPALETEPAVSIFIPTRDHWHLLGPCLKSLQSTEWPRDRLEIIVIDNGSTDTETIENIAAAEAASQIRVIRDARRFNYAALNNVAARAARGDVFVLLNNDTEIIDPAWLRKLVAHTVQPGVGAVGAKLLYGDRTVQHGGIILGIQGAAGHAHVFLGESEGGFQHLANVTHEVAAVTGACLAVTRAAWEAVGGLREEFEVAFNDLVFCLDLLEAGYRNIYAANCVMIHHESKTRGFDTTPQKIAIARREALRAWRYHPALMRDDPYYSPNLSHEVPYKLAFAPRRRALWRPPVAGALKIMMLSSTHARGHGVAVVIERQVRALRQRGHEVILAGGRSDRDFPYGGTEVIEVHDPRSAATLAVDLGVDVIVAHTPPYFGVARWTGAFPPVIGYDYGEPPPEYFPDAAARLEVLADKNASLRMCTRVFAISQAIADESLVPPDGVIPLGNSHLGSWTPALEERRTATRRARGWDGRFVVLNVSRFHAGERHYKGVDQYAEALAMLKSIDPELAACSVFVLCGKGNEQDVAETRASGLTVVANVSDEEMTDLYAAADLYANFSRWEGYNLGIGQALALGLPVIASDIPAHRAFGVTVVENSVSAAFAVREQLGKPAERAPRVWEWDEQLRLFCDAVEQVAYPPPAASAEIEPEIASVAE